MERKEVSEHAQVAKLIRGELRERWPAVKFSVRSSSFSGGDAVDIRYTLDDETGPTSRAVEALAGKYQAGRFDGMTDSYEYDASKTGPTVKYVMVHCDFSKLAEKHKPAFLKAYGLEAFEDAIVRAKLGMWKEQALYRYLHEVVLEGR